MARSIAMRHPGVDDALVIGIADDTWGQAVNAVVQLAAGAILNEAMLKEHVRARLAGYKTPKRLFVADRSLRVPNGKADYGVAVAPVRAQLMLPADKPKVGGIPRSFWARLIDYGKRTSEH